MSWTWLYGFLLIFKFALQFLFNLTGTPDIVQSVDHRFGGGLHNIGRQTNAVELAAVVAHDDIDLTQRILAVAFRGQLVVNQLSVELGDTVNRLVDRVNRAITSGCIRFSDIAAAQIDRGGGGEACNGLDVKFV